MLLALTDNPASTESMLAWFTAALVVVGVLQVAVLAMQGWLVRRQDEHFRNSERAWLLAELGWYEKGLHVADGMSKDFGGLVTEHTGVNVKLTCRNEGRSPAWIDGIHTRVDIIRKVEGGVPKKADLHPCGVIPPLGAGKERSRILQLSLLGHRTKDDYLSIYVLIEYHDIFGIKRQTTLGSTIDVNNEIYPQEALTERNRNT